MVVDGERWLHFGMEELYRKLSLSMCLPWGIIEPFTAPPMYSGTVNLQGFSTL